MTCNAGPYATGIRYENVGQPFALQVAPGVLVSRNNGAGVWVEAIGTDLMEVDLQAGSSLTIGGGYGSGLYSVRGTDGNIHIVSAANIVVNVSGAAPVVEANGLLAQLTGTASGRIDMTQLAGSSIQVTAGYFGRGLFGEGEGQVDVALRTAGAVTVNSMFGAGVFGSLTNGSQGHIDVRLDHGALVTVSGTNTAGVAAEHYGQGGLDISVDGTVKVTGADASGVLSSLYESTNTGEATVAIGASAQVSAQGSDVIGAYAFNDSLGRNRVLSAGVLSAQGDNAMGIYHLNMNAANTQHHELVLYGDSQVSVSGLQAVGVRTGSQGAGDMQLFLYDRASIEASGVGAGGIEMSSAGTNRLTQAAGTRVSVTGNGATALWAQATLANQLSLAGRWQAVGQGARGIEALSQDESQIQLYAGAEVRVSGRESYGVLAEAAGNNRVWVAGNVRAQDEFAIGARLLSPMLSVLTVQAGGVIQGGWQAALNDTGAATALPSAGVVVEGPQAEVHNSGEIGALSDRAVADAGRWQATGGNLRLYNSGVITGFVELAGAGVNEFTNQADGLWLLRHEADTNGDGVRDTRRVAVSDFGASSSSLTNASGATIRVASPGAASSVDNSGFVLPARGLAETALDSSFYTLNRGISQAQLVNLGAFHNAGTVDLRGAQIGNSLVITSAATASGAAGSSRYVSEGGALWVNANTAYSDVLILDQTALGSAPTQVHVAGRAEAGAAATADGVLVVQVRDKSQSAPGAFVLAGDYQQEGEQRILVGANSYALLHHGANEADGNWYLRARGPGAHLPLYEAYARVLLPLMRPGSWQQRVGNRRWVNAQASAAAPLEQTFSGEQRLREGVTGIWVRQEGRFLDLKDLGSSQDASLNAKTYTTHAGGDWLVHTAPNSRLMAGINVLFGQTNARVDGAVVDGRIDVRQQGVGASLTWLYDHGHYVDAQVGVSRFDSTIKSSMRQRRLQDGNKGEGLMASLEVGTRLPLGGDWALVPQAQVSRSRVRFDDFTDPFGAQVALASGDSLRTRVGLALERHPSQVFSGPRRARWRGYGIINLYKEFKDGSQVDVSGRRLGSEGRELWGGVGVGGLYEWQNGRYAVFGEAAANSRLKDLGRSTEGTVSLGVRLQW